MDILTTVGFAIAVFVVILFAIFIIGLKTKMPDSETNLEMELTKYEQWTDDIPKLIIKHYESIYENKGMPVIKTVMLKGKASYKISNLWMPLIYHSWVEQGTGFLRELEFYWYGKVILKGVDFWIKGVGALRVNGVIRMNETGKNVTESQLTSFLAESLLLGTFDFSREQLKWNIVDENTVILTTPSCDGEIKGSHTIRVDFDGKTGRIKSLSAERFRGQMEVKRIAWMIAVNKWEKKQEMWVPEYNAKWEDQKKPWCQYKITNVFLNANPKAVREAISKISTSKYKSEIKIDKKASIKTGKK